MRKVNQFLLDIFPPIWGVVLFKVIGLPYLMIYILLGLMIVTIDILFDLLFDLGAYSTKEKIDIRLNIGMALSPLFIIYVYYIIYKHVTS